MAMIFDSDEENELEGMLDEEDSEDDEDYVPDKGNQHSDSDHDGRGARSKRKVKSPTIKSPKGRSSNGSSKTSIKPSGRPAKNSKASNKTPIKTPVKTSSKTAPKPRRKSKSSSKTENEEDDNEVASSLRRSSRNSSHRSVSYADADLSNEEFDEEDDLLFIDEKEKEKKKHVEDLWSSFKQDTKKQSRKSATPKKIEEIEKNSEQEREVNKETDNLEKENVENEIKDTVSQNDKEHNGDEKVTETLVDTEKNVFLHVSDKENSNSKSEDQEKYSCKSDIDNTSLLETKVETEKVANSDEKKVDNPDISNNAENSNLKKDARIEDETNITADEEKLSSDGKKVTITESYDFAGEEIKVSKTVDVSEIKNKEPEKPATAVSGLAKVTGLKRPGGGLASVMGSLEKKKKISVLDKTKLDWNSYKDDEGLEEELKSNRNAGYLDKQEFLQRVDYKQWENEREMRLYSNRK